MVLCRVLYGTPRPCGKCTELKTAFAAGAGCSCVVISFYIKRRRDYDSDLIKGRRVFGPPVSRRIAAKPALLLPAPCPWRVRMSPEVSGSWPGWVRASSGGSYIFEF